MASNQHEAAVADDVEEETRWAVGSTTYRRSNKDTLPKKPRKYRRKPKEDDITINNTSIVATSISSSYAGGGTTSGGGGNNSKTISSSSFKLRPSMLLGGGGGGGGGGGEEGANDDEDDNGVLPVVVDFIDMENHTSQLKSSVDVDEPLFQPCPSTVRFKDYKPYSIYEQQLYFRNNDTVPRRIKVLLPTSPYFEISGLKAPTKGKELKDSKVAAGMEVSFTIRFKPQEVSHRSSGSSSSSSSSTGGSGGVMVVVVMVAMMF